MHTFAQVKRKAKHIDGFSIGISLFIRFVFRINSLKKVGIMKRFGLTIVAALCLSVASFAAGNQPTTEKWEVKINVEKLSKYLNLDSKQAEEVANICEYFSEQVDRANHAKNDKEQQMRNAVYGNLKLMKKTLNDKQFADYARVLNATLQNKGIKVD